MEPCRGRVAGQPDTVSNRRELDQRRRVLGDIREIMSAMKTLAYMETRKLDRTMGAQRAVVGQIETIAEDFLGCYPETLPPADGLKPVCLLLGSCLLYTSPSPRDS